MISAITWWFELVFCDRLMGGADSGKRKVEYMRCSAQIRKLTIIMRSHPVINARFSAHMYTGTAHLRNQVYFPIVASAHGAPYSLIGSEFTRPHIFIPRCYLQGRCESESNTHTCTYGMSLECDEAAIRSNI